MTSGSPCELLAAAADAEEAFRTAIQEMIRPAIEATLTGEQSAVDDAAAAMAPRVPEVMAAHVPGLVALYDQLTPLVPDDIAAHVVALRDEMVRFREGLVAAAGSFDGVSAVMNDPAGEAAGRSLSALTKYRRETCGS